MFTGLAFLSGAALLGLGLIRSSILRRLLNPAEQLLWGLVSGWILTTLGAYCVARVRGGLSYGQMLVFTIVVWIFSLLLWFKPLQRIRREDLRLRTIWRPEYSGLGLVLALFTPIYLRLFSTHMLAPAAGGVYSGGSAWYDMSFHASLSSSFLYGRNFPPLYTMLPPEPLRYPFLPDFQTAALMAAGLSLRTALMITALVLTLATTGLLYSFAYFIARSQKAAVLATMLFLLNGGLGFIDFFRDWWTSGNGFIQFWNTLGVNYANYSERGIHWTNIIVDTLLPQRASLFGLPLALMIFTVFAINWRRWHEDISENEPTDAKEANDLASWMLMLTAGVLTGLLPIIHTHTYIAVGLISLFLFFFRPRWTWLAFWAPAVLLAAPYLLPLVREASAGGILRLLPGWLGLNESFFPLYLLRNFGLPLLLAVPAWLALPGVWRKFYLAFLLLFVFSFVVVVSPNTFDNGKLTYYWHAVNSVLVASWLVKLATVYRQRLIASLLVVLCVATGIAALQSENLKWQQLFTVEEIAVAEYVRQNTAPRALFLTAPAFNQPVTCLAGRPVIRGPTAWLWSHGYEFREREADVRRIYTGTADALELLRYYSIDYVYLGDAERSDLKADPLFFENNFAVVYRSTNVTIYDARTLPGAAVQASDARTGSLNAPAPRELASRLGRDPSALLVEFQHTSFFVYRLSKASYGRLPRMNEFMTAMTEIGRGLLIAAPGWESQLEMNRTSLLNAWMNSKDFTQSYDEKTNVEFVNALLTNTGVDWNNAKRDALVKHLDSGAGSRQSALLSVVEDKDFYAREYNTAYVLVHFFGYLRRNPDDPPDRSLSGLNFWRDVLDRSGDYRTLSRAFLESDEYKNSPPAP
jgi:hypothetical protein